MTHRPAWLLALASSVALATGEARAHPQIDFEAESARFEAATEDGLAQLLSRFDLAGAARVWSDLAAGPPRLATTAYSWERAELPGVGLGF